MEDGKCRNKLYCTIVGFLSLELTSNLAVNTMHVKRTRVVGSFIHDSYYYNYYCNLAAN